MIKIYSLSLWLGIGFFSSSSFHAGKALGYGLSDYEPEYVQDYNYVEARTKQSKTISRNSFLNLSYMTAQEMQETVISLTGFRHPGFIVYQDVLGTIDSSTGLRTTDRPSLVSIMFMKQIAKSVAAAVIKRETFLDQEERIVFRGVDLEVSPGSSELNNFIALTYENWIGQTPSELSLRILHDSYRQAESLSSPIYAYSEFISLMLQHGGNYYY